MIMTFFDSKGMIYSRCLAIGCKVNSDIFVETMRAFLKAYHKKRPASKDWFLHMDNAPCHKSKVTTDFLAKKGIKLLPHPPYSPDLAPCDFWLFGKVKADLGGKLIEEETVRYEWERAVRTISTSEFRATFNRWLEHHEKCIRVGGEYIERL